MIPAHGEALPLAPERRHYLPAALCGVPPPLPRRAATAPTEFLAPEEECHHYPRCRPHGLTPSGQTYRLLHVLVLNTEAPAASYHELQQEHPSPGCPDWPPPLSASPTPPSSSLRLENLSPASSKRCQRCHPRHLPQAPSPPSSPTARASTMSRISDRRVGRRASPDRRRGPRRVGFRHRAAPGQRPAPRGRIVSTVQQTAAAVPYLMLPGRPWTRAVPLEIPPQSQSPKPNAAPAPNPRRNTFEQGIHQAADHIENQLEVPSRKGRFI